MRKMHLFCAMVSLLALLFFPGSSRAQTFTGSNAPGASSDFSFSVGAPSTNLSVIVPGSGSGYSDLLLKRGSPPTDTSFDYMSTLAAQTNSIHLELPEFAAGTYFIRVRTPAASPAHTFTVLVQTNLADMRSINRPVSKPLGAQFTGQISANERQYFKFDLTNSINFRISLDSTFLAPDLFLHRNQTPSDTVYLKRSTNLTNDSILMLDTEAFTGNYFLGVFSAAGSPTNAAFTVRIDPSPLQTLAWDPGITHEGTLAQSNFTAAATDYYFKITTANPSLGAWRTALKVFAGEANLYLSRGTPPTVAQADFRSERVGSDGFVLSSVQFAPSEVWYILVRALANSRWTLVSGAPYVMDLGTVTADGSSGSGEVVMGPEGMRFFSAQVPPDMLAWRLWLNGASNTIVLKKTSLPVGVAGSELFQVGQTLVVPPYLTGNQQYFIGIIGSPGTTNILDSRYQPVIPLNYGSSAANVVTGFPYTTYQVQVPPQQIAWQIAIPSINGNPNVSVRRNSVPNENNNDALSELATTVTDNITLVPPVLSDGTFYITVWATNAHQFTLENGPAVITDINYIDTVLNNDPDRVGWRFFRVADINQQLGSLGWELSVTNAAPGTRIAIRRNAAPSTWSFRNPSPATTTYYDLISSAQTLQHPGHQADVWYVGVYNPTNRLGNFTLLAREIQAQPLFNNVPEVRTNNPPGLWQFFSIDVPSMADGNPVFGWDVRLLDVTNNPAFVIRRDALPDSFISSFSLPINVTNWPTRSQWAAGADWTGRSFPAVGTTNENGRIIATGMGRPLEPGRYYIGVQSALGFPQPTSYSLLSRWIGTNQPIPIRSLNWSGVSYTNTVTPRFADYYAIDVPPNKRSFKVHLRTVSGEAMAVVSKDTLPNVTSTANNLIFNTAGKNVQKIGDEYLTILPPRGTNFVQVGTYYIAVIGEGQNPADNSRIGTNTTTYVLETLGEIPEPYIGELGTVNLVTTGTLFGGEIAAYHFTTTPDVLGFWISLEDRIGNPIAVSRLGPSLADPGLGTGIIQPDLYGQDGGESSGAIAGTFISVADPGAIETIMVKARQSGLPGVFPDASYTLRIDEIVPQALAFDGGLTNVSGQDPLRGAFFYVDVPQSASGWDLRITNVTSGNPQLAICRDFLPISFTTTPGFTPNSQTNWPSAVRWAASRDWTERPLSPQGISEDGRILAMGMGRPLEPGRYYIGVLSGAGSQSMSYTLVSRGIGDGFTIPITPLNLNGGTFSGTNLAPREAAYFRVDVPAGMPSWKMTLGTTAGEALLVAAKDTLPNVLAGSALSVVNSAGRKIQKSAEEYFLLLPPLGSNSVLAGTYYLAVVGEGVAPAPFRVGTGASDFTITSRGVAPVRNLGLLGFTDLVESNSLAGGDTQIYQFSIPVGTLGVEARLENRIGNPVMVLRPGTAVPDPGAGGTVPVEPYGHEFGELINSVVHPTLINLPNPTNTVCTLVVMARQISGVFSNATYTLRLNASGSTTLDFDGGSFSIANQSPQTWKYFRVVVPTNSLGWDIRLLDVTNGLPRMAIRRETLPNSLATTPWSTPGSSVSWPTNSQWAPGQDWTHRSLSAADPLISEDGRVFAAGMGRPLEPGTYFVGVFNSSATAAAYYRILSRGIGSGFSIPVVDVPFVGASTGSLPGREAAYFRVYVPSNTPSWKVKLTGVAGESILVALRGLVPNIDLNLPAGSLTAGKGMQKPGNEHFVLLPVTGQTNITAGTNYFAVVSEGVNPPSSTRLGSGNSTFTFESQGHVTTNNLGLLTSEDIFYPDTVEGGEMKLYQFVIPSGMLGLKVRLENRVGNPTFVLRQGDKIPDPGAAVPAVDFYGNEGGYITTDGHSTLYTIANPVPGLYTLVVKGRPLAGNYTDATYTLHLQEVLVPELNFTASLNTNGLSNSGSGVLEDNERVFYKFVIPSTHNGQPVIGWKLDLVQSSGLASMRVRKDLLPSDANALAQTPFATAQSIIVPPFLTNGVWYVEVKGAGSTAFTLTSSALSLERPAWIMPGPGETNQTPGVSAPLFGDTAIDTNGVPFSEQSTFLEQGFLHYYAVSIPDANAGLFRAVLEAVSGNPDLYLRYAAAPTLYHNPQGVSGAIYDRSMLANATEYANWVPLDGKLEAKLRPGLWYMAVRAAGNANARYRLKVSVGTIIDITLNSPDLTNQLAAAGDWRYYRFTAPATLPGGFNLIFSQQSGDVIVHLRDTVPPGNGATGSASDLKDWVTDAKNNGPYASYDAPNTYSFAVPPVRPGAVYYFGVRALSDAVFTIRGTTNGAPNSEPTVIPFYGGLAITNLAPGGQAFYRIDVPLEATRWKHTATHAAGVYVGIEQGTIPRPGSEDYRNNLSIANSTLNQYLLSAWPWLPGQSYFIVISNTTAQVQDVVFAMDGKNAVTDDNDADGLPDAWELQYFGNTTSQASAGDPDRDGVTNYDEYLEGTNPNDAASFQARLITAALNGSITRSPDAPSYALNSQVTLTAIPAAGYAFIGWTGNASGRQNPLLLTMDGHKTIGATFKLAGDDFITALPLVGNSVTAVATNVGMSKEPGEPNHAGNPGGKSIWWRWVAPAAGSVTLTTAGSAFNTLLGVYTGASVSNLTWVASDNNSGGTSNRSIVHFNALSGTTYNIAVDGYNGASSRVNLSLVLGSGARPRFNAISQFADGRAECVIAGDPNRTYNLEVSTNLVTWTFLGTISTDGTGVGRFTDAQAPAFTQRFYRTRD